MILNMRQRRSGSWGLAVWGVVLTACLGLGGYGAARYLWVRSCYKAAREAMDRRDFTQAHAAFRLCTQYRQDDPEIHFLTAQAFRRAALFGAVDPNWASEAGRELNEAERLKYVPEAITTERALLSLADGELPRVESYLVGQVSQDSPDTTLILEALVPAYLEAHRLPWALLSVGKLLAREPDHFEGLYWRGLTRESLFYNEQAAEDYRRVLGLKPDHDRARLRLARRLVATQEYAEAEDLLKEAAEHEPGNPEVLLALARCRIGQSRLQEAGQLLDQVLTVEPRNGAALGERGKVALEQGRAVEGERWLRQALELDPDDQQAANHLYQCLLQQGKKDEAASILANLNRIMAGAKQFRDLMDQIQRRPQDPVLRCEAGVLLLRHGQTAHALGWLNGALQIDPLHMAAHKALADYYTSIGRPDRAEHHRRLAVEGMSRRLRQLSILWVP